MSLLYYLGLVALARLLGSPVFLFAMGVETLDGAWARRLTRIVLNGRKVTITVRDEMSKRMLVEIGIPETSIHITADPVFARTTESAPRERYVHNASTALLIPRFPCPARGRTMFAIMARILRDQRKMQVRGVLFQPATEAVHLKSFSGEPILSEDDFLQGLELEDMVARVSSFDWIISARFHGLVLAALAGKPFIGIGDPHKVGRLCDLLKMPFLTWGSDESTIAAAIERLALKGQSTPGPQIERLRDAALRTANHVG